MNSNFSWLGNKIITDITYSDVIYKSLLVSNIHQTLFETGNPILYRYFVITSFESNGVLVSIIQ